MRRFEFLIHDPIHDPVHGPIHDPADDETDSENRSLAPFFSPLLLSAASNGLFIAGGILFIFWPRQELFQFIGTNSAPLLFFHVFSTTILIQAYLNLRCGRGEMVEQDEIDYLRKEVPAYEAERSFLRYGLPGFVVHTLFLMLPFLPLLLVGSSVSGIAAVVFAEAVSALFITSLLCRLFGFFVYLLWGRLSYAGYLTIRGFGIFFLFATAAHPSAPNPLRLLYQLNQEGPSHDPFRSYAGAVFAAVLLLALIDGILVSRKIRREKTM